MFVRFRKIFDSPCLGSWISVGANLGEIPKQFLLDLRLILTERSELLSGF